MSILDRLFGKPPDEPEEVVALGEAIAATQHSLDMLREKLDQDPCAADPNREECSPELRRALRDVAGTLLSGRDAWR